MDVLISREDKDVRSDLHEGHSRTSLCSTALEHPVPISEQYKFLANKVSAA